MDALVTSFPFNINNDLMSSYPAGIYLPGVVHLVYRVALAFEGPFTSEIYRKREESRVGPGASGMVAGSKKEL
ncbi:hypothetical protein BGW39_004935 [Mortierella sp. 14UC]|nr:hypothetical protein BGW39_004935 [Mortierella sp. 14UC]